jgi:sugar/nucleoside kinase (ribokinase family)
MRVGQVQPAHREDAFVKKIVVAGEILVEIMADTTGDGFRGPIALTGPYPSGAPAIFIDQVALLGQPCGIISMVGNDDFGRLNVDRLARDGVDVSAIGVDSDRPTGSAFVRYRADGSRDFVFNIRHSACGTLPQSDAVQVLLQTADHLHVMGSSLSSPEIIGFNMDAARAIRARGGSVSFDPNLRKEILDARGMAEAMQAILALTDLFLPSGDEIALLTSAKDAAGAAAELLSHGIKAIVHKQGATGVNYIDASGAQFVPSFKVQEVDPTGAGDCFGGAFTALWLRGEDIHRALTIAAAAGALAVTRRGPMEGASSMEALLAFAASQGRPV